MTTLTITANDADQTLINYLKKVFKTLPLSKIYHLFRTKKIRVNNKTTTDFKYRLQENDLVVIYESNLVVNYKPEKITKEAPIELFYEDDNFLIVNKDHNIVVHQPYGSCLDNMVKYYLQQKYPKKKREQTFNISHQYRLDKLTKGLIIYPKNKMTQNALHNATKNGQIIKKYLAICSGQLTKNLNISGYITHDELTMKMKFSIEPSEQSKSCSTIFTPIFNTKDFTLVECQLVTGRKHQIRSTLQFLNLPIVGDTKYGSTIVTPNKIALFAYYLSFNDLEEPFTYLNDQNFIIKDLKTDLIKQIKKEKW
ncbi:RluA family pseudouridine synthase [Spiroplasma endosymbiont of Tricholauxania praeusta]|uniref:RluA family pseudouridine synthase n=1 Tax=Spiroplasma endosymbiont of Tricholauxania praeusta TaxID=3066296 RepID=UPI0030D3B904